MRVVVINNIAGRFDRLQAFVERLRTTEIAALFVLSNLVADSVQRQADDQHRLPTDLPRRRAVAASRAAPSDNQRSTHNRMEYT